MSAGSSTAQAPAKPALLARGANRWLTLIGLVLAMALAGVVWIQYRQIALLDGKVRYEGDNLVWSIFQVESEYLQLRDALREGLRRPEQDHAEQIRLQYALFASRLPLVDPARTRTIADLGENHVQTVALLQAFLERHDPVLAEESTLAIKPAYMDQVLADMATLVDRIHDLTLQTNHVMATLVGRRNDAVRDQNRLGIALTVLQSVLVLAFFGVAARQFRLLRLQRREQDQLTGHLQQAQAEAVRASQAKSVFLANMSHELRTPFNGMLGMLALLEGSPLQPTQADYLRTARESAVHLLGLLNDVLDFSKLESGQVDIRPAPTDLALLLREVINLNTPLAAAKGLSLSLHLADSLPAGVMTDGQRLRQILHNLCANAVKFTEHGQVGLSASCAAADPPQDDRLTLRIDVTDTGIGMDETLRARLFQRFAQGDDGTTRRYGGSGLGLEISRNLAQRMAGDIQVHSEPDKGSCFSLSLPVQACDLPPPVPMGPALTTPAQPALPALDLLVVDDHPVNRRYMALLLESMGHRVRLANDGVQAVQEVQRQTPDLVFMDLHMPVQDGFAATLALRALPAPASAVTVVALSADVFSETRERVQRAGMSHFLAKPVQPDDIRDLLNQLFGSENAAAPGASPGSPAQAQAPENAPLSMPAPTPVPAKPLAPAPGPDAPRRFRSADVAAHLDMATIGNVCVGVSLSGYRQLLTGLIADQAGNQAALLAALDGAHVDALHDLAHSIKGAAASLGLRSVAAVARHIEAEATGMSADDCAVQAALLRQHLADTQALLLRMGLA